MTEARQSHRTIGAVVFVVGLCCAGAVFLFLSVSDWLSGGDRELDKVVAVGDPPHMTQFLKFKDIFDPCTYHLSRDYNPTPLG